jgi:hypothetical protein
MSEALDNAGSVRLVMAYSAADKSRFGQLVTNGPTDQVAVQ